uniref:Uncharacterized protein n=1 Tax=Arundo donax TaxID=35708 RepID=A0A0A9EM25_ARUDO
MTFEFSSETGNKPCPARLNLESYSPSLRCLAGERERDDGVDSWHGTPQSAALWSPENLGGIPLAWLASRYLCFMASCNMDSLAPI